MEISDRPDIVYSDCITNALYNDIINSNDSIAEIEKSAVEIHDKLEKIILDNVDRIDLQPDIEKISKYSTENDDTAIINSYELVKGGLLSKKKTPIKERILKNWNKASPEFAILKKQSELCQYIAGDNGELFFSIGRCKNKAKEVTDKIYETVEQWEKEISIKENISGINKRLLDDLSNNPLHLSGKEGFLDKLKYQRVSATVQEKIESCKNRIENEYESRLNNETKYILVYNLIKEKGLKGRIRTDDEKNDLFKEYCFKNNKEKENYEKEKKERPEDGWLKLTKYLFNREADNFADGIDSYNEITEQKEKWTKEISNVNETYKAKIDQLIKEFNESMKDNRFYLKIDTYAVSNHGKRGWINPIWNLR
jgi:hypothetical protein